MPSLGQRTRGGQPDESGANNGNGMLLRSAIPQGLARYAERIFR